MNRRTTIRLSDASGWRSPVMFLMLMAVVNGISAATWGSLLNNFAIEQASFTGREIGILQSLREVPGLLAFTAVGWLLFIREQNFALLALLFLTAGVAFTGFVPFALGLNAITMLMSFGFHYYETMNQSLSLQWLPKDRAPHLLGRIFAAGSAASIVSYGVIFLLWKWLELDFVAIYLIGGGLGLALVI